MEIYFECDMHLYEYAKFLIEITYKGIKYPAFESGFKNTSHFASIFKQT